MVWSSEPNMGTSKGHILLVDDDEGCCEAYGKLLRNAGFDVDTTSRFAEALDILEAERPVDLLLTDIVMPGSVNGLALSRMGRMRCKHLKVVYLTGYNIPGAEREALGPILMKPVDGDRMICEVEGALAA